jgi:hypothetical protein
VSSPGGYSPALREAIAHEDRTPELAEILSTRAVEVEYRVKFGVRVRLAKAKDLRLCVESAHLMDRESEYVGGIPTTPIVTTCSPRESNRTAVVRRKMALSGVRVLAGLTGHLPPALTEESAVWVAIDDPRFAVYQLKLV